MLSFPYGLGHIVYNSQNLTYNAIALAEGQKLDRLVFRVQIKHAF